MKVIMSKFLEASKSDIRKLIENLSEDFNYVSVLGTDSHGKQYRVQKTGISVQDSFWNERGFVVRIHNGINYSELSFNNISGQNMDGFAAEIKQKVKSELAEIKKSKNINGYPLIKEEKIKEEFIGEVDASNKEINDKDIIGKLIKLKDKAFLNSKLLVDFKLNFQQVHVSKIFLSKNKELTQSYIWSEGSILPIVRDENSTKFNYAGASGLKGAELLDELDEKIENCIYTAEKLLKAKPVKPGEYETICSPEVSGIIAHEAFGHGVEMDMFVKHRAKAEEYLGKQVASELVTMHDGASAAHNVSSYLFDDEGVIGKDTVVIHKGILKAGISDMLSALKLNTEPTGNGKRQSFERKTYTRMTNTYFASGNDELSDMIASIKDGYLLERPMSGMEDPKNWGIQCMVNYGREIKNGKLTGNIVAPIVLTGYVPDLLKSISMVSKEVLLEGTGACGKGYKEFVKVSSGGPYIKAKVRLG